MDREEPDAIFYDGMNSFLEKYPSQPYRGGFHESQWEEVGGPGSQRVRAWASSQLLGPPGR